MMHIEYSQHFPTESPGMPCSHSTFYLDAFVLLRLCVGVDLSLLL